jgi:rod shape determining protein RodA
MLERPWYRSFNFALAASAVALTIFGLVVVKSASLHVPGGQGDFLHQLAFAIVGFLIMALLAFLDYHLWQRLAWPLYIVNVLILAAVALHGHQALGAQRWIGIGPFVFQPSEPAKLLTILSLGAILADPHRSWSRLRDLWLPLTLVALPTALVMKQPDLGTALVLVAILSAMLFLALPKLLHFAAYATTVVLGGALAVMTPYFLKGYQRQRLLVFLDPKHDPQGAGWSLIQSKIAVGSGELTGKGLYHGTQTQLGFVPAHATDFVFAVIGEELGFLGALLLLGLYALLLAFGVFAINAARDRFGMLVAAGVVAMFAFHILVNVGMTIGIMPVTGIPLPFISYGGSSLITCFAAVGIVLNIDMHRDKVLFD